MTSSLHSVGTSRPLAMACATLGILLSLAGCQTVTNRSAPPAVLQGTLPGAKLAQHQWQGHFSIKLGPWGKQAADGQSFTFFLQTEAADPSSGQLDLMTPLGTQLAKVVWTPAGTRIESAEGTEHYASLNDLSTRLLGEDVPLQALPDWLQGVPSDKLESAKLLPDHTGFEQAGWTIDAHALPDGRLQANRPQSSTQRQILIKVRLEQP